MPSIGVKKVLGKVAGPVIARLAPPFPLHVGSVAPHFTLRAHDGQQISTHDLEGNSSFVLIFYPGDDTPGCTEQLKQFNARLDDFARAGIRVFGINPANADSHRAFAEKLGLRIPLLVDEGRRVAVEYWAARKHLPFVFRTVYLIDRQRVVRFSERGMPDVGRVLEVGTTAGTRGFRDEQTKAENAAGLGYTDDITPAKALRMWKELDDYILVDIRPAWEFEEGHLPQAYNIPVDDLPRRLDELGPKDRPVFVIDNKGIAGGGAAQFIFARGWTRTYHISGGMYYWEEKMGSKNFVKGPATAPRSDSTA